MFSFPQSVNLVVRKCHRGTFYNNLGSATAVQIIKRAFPPFNPTGIQVNGHFQGQSIKQTPSESQPRGEADTTMTACLEEDNAIIDTGNEGEQIFHDPMSKPLLDSRLACK